MLSSELIVQQLQAKAEAVESSCHTTSRACTAAADQTLSAPDATITDETNLEDVQAWGGCHNIIMPYYYSHQHSLIVRCCRADIT